MTIVSIGESVQKLRHKFSHSTGLPLQRVLPATTIEAALSATGGRGRVCVLDPVLTLWAFVGQVLDSDRTCRKALSRIWAYLADSPVEVDATQQADSGAYCKARQRLPTPAVERLYSQVAQGLESTVTPTALADRRVFVADGTTVLMPDTPANRQAYAQGPNQPIDCGFPMAKVVALFSMQTGALTAATHTIWSSYEPPMLRQIAHDLQPGDVIVGDRVYSSFANIALLRNQRKDVVFRLAAPRKIDWHQGQRLGKNDRLVVWKKPHACPKELSAAGYAHLPDTLTLRVLRYTIPRPGYRARQVTLVTTLLDPQRYTQADLARLYGLRWQVEINLRHLKASMDMDMLRTKSPAMVRKELAVYFLAYNLIRTLMVQAGQYALKPPLRLSFKATLQHLNTFLPLLAMATPTQRRAYFNQLLGLVAREQLPDRPHRIEPRVVKRRPKCSKWMQQSRAILKQKLVA